MSNPIAENKKGERVEFVGGKWESIPSAINAFGRNMAGSMFESSQNLVEKMVNAPIDVANKVSTDVNSLFGKNLPPESDSMIGSPNLPNFQPRNGPPQIPNVSLPKSSRDDLFAATQMGGEAAAAVANGNFEQFSQNPVAQQQAISESGERNHPVASGLGDLFGPALLVSGSRSPQAMANNVREIARNQLASRNGFGFMQGAAKGANGRGALSLKAAVDRAFTTSGTAQFVASRFPRAIEAGTEGAIIALIDEGDPLEVAAWSAGTQAAGSLAITMLSDIAGSGGIANKGMRLAGGAAGISMFMELAKQVMPGGEDRDFARIFESFGTTTAKLAGGMALGAFAGIAGMGRAPTRERAVMDAAATFSDAITALPRNTVFSIINDWTKDDRIEPVINKLREDPMYFGNEASRRLERAFVDGGASMTTILDDLSKNKQFQERLEAL